MRKVVNAVCEIAAAPEETSCIVDQLLAHTIDLRDAALAEFMQKDTLLARFMAAHLPRAVWSTGLAISVPCI